jgi:transposase-like protein
MEKKRRTFSARQKSKIALEAIREREPSSAIAKKYTVHPNQVSQWKMTALDGLEELFRDRRRSEAHQKEQGELTEQLYSQIGQLQMELKWLKKKFGEL